MTISDVLIEAIDDIDGYLPPRVGEEAGDPTYRGGYADSPEVLEEIEFVKAVMRNLQIRLSWAGLGEVPEPLNFGTVGPDVAARLRALLKDEPAGEA